MTVSGAYTDLADNVGATGATDTVAIDRFEAPANQAPIVKNDKWVLSDTIIPTGTITPTWFLNNDTDPDGSTLYVMNVQGLTGTGLMRRTMPQII